MSPPIVPAQVSAPAVPRARAPRVGPPVTRRVDRVAAGGALRWVAGAARGGLPWTAWMPQRGWSFASLGGLPRERRLRALEIVDTAEAGPEGLPVLVFGGAFSSRTSVGRGAWGAWPSRTRRLPRQLVAQCSYGPEECAWRASMGPGAALDWAPAAVPEGAPVGWEATPVESRAAWSARVVAAEAACAEGRLEKVVLARAVRWALPAQRRVDAAATLAAMRAAHPAATLFAFGDGLGRVFLGATPEALVRLRGDRVETHALAGTAPRGLAEGHALLNSAKDRREHALVVADLRGRLGRLCEQVWVAPRPSLRAAGGVQHLETRVVGRRRPGVELADLVRVLHPTAALGGAPRDAALEWLARHEPLDRGWYGAPVGWASAEGEGEASVAIRSAWITDEGVWAFAGAGVVAGSEPEREWSETEWKLGAVRETLRLVPR